MKRKWDCRREEGGRQQVALAGTGKEKFHGRHERPTVDEWLYPVSWQDYRLMSVFYTGEESSEWLDKYWTDSGNRFIATEEGHPGMEVVFIPHT